MGIECTGEQDHGDNCAECLPESKPSDTKPALPSSSVQMFSGGLRDTILV